MTFGSGEIDPSQSLGGAGIPVRTATPAQNQVTFSRRIEKNPKLERRQGVYSVISASGLVVRRGHELDRVLRSIDRSLALVAN